jgi:prepilin-type N-terminal cleavage/methylation domain-containing protein
MSTKSTKHGKLLKGFTLIELLVVIAIIAILLSIIVPSLKKAKEHAQTVLCKSNLHQYALGIRTYLNDNKEQFPHPELVYLDWTKYSASDINNWGHWYCRWHHPESKWEFNGQLWPYLAAEKSHLCPVFSRVATRDGCYWCKESSGRNFQPRYTYSQNTYLGHYAFSASGKICGERGSRKIGNVVSPSTTLLFTEENTLPIAGYNQYGLNDNVFMPSPGNNSIGDAIATFHSVKSDGARFVGKGHVLFVDGSFELRSYEESYILASPNKVR